MNQSHISTKPNETLKTFKADKKLVDNLNDKFCFN